MTRRSRKRVAERTKKKHLLVSDGRPGIHIPWVVFFPSSSERNHKRVDFWSAIEGKVKQRGMGGQARRKVVGKQRTR